MQFRAVMRVDAQVRSVFAPVVVMANVVAYARMPGIG